MLTKKDEIKEAILEVLRQLPKEPGYPPSAYVFDAEEIIRYVRQLRVMRALKELMDEGRVEWDEEGKGWRPKPS